MIDFDYVMFYGRRARYCANTFPYACADGIAHQLLWFSGAAPDVEAIVREEEGDVPFVYFENVPSNRSITEVRHYHVFVNRAAAAPGEAALEAAAAALAAGEIVVVPTDTVYGLACRAPLG